LVRGGQEEVIKVLAFALYGPLAASTRYRLGQYVPGLEAMGISMEIRSLLGDDYLRQRFKGGRLPLGAMLRDGASRLGDLWHLRDFDLAVIHCELFPFMPSSIERMLVRTPYVYDMDDAFYLRYRLGRLGAARPLLGSKFDRVMAGAAAVTCGSKVLSQYALKHNHRVTDLPTVVDIERYVPAKTQRNDVFTVGWIGSPTTSVYLSELVEPLSALGREGPVNFVVIGGTAPSIPNVNVVHIRWEEVSEVAHINGLDVGVMPLYDDDWARGKCAFKLIQYMACGIPVVASHVGANVEVVTPECGFLAADSGAWLAALRRLRDEPQLRRRMGVAARERVAEHYSLQTALPTMANVIRRTFDDGPIRRE
jgi:glycosyltransferase involved in cell wall biosynthesis